MGISTSKLTLLLGVTFLGANLTAQIKIKKPEIEIKKPTIGTGTGSGSGSGDAKLPGVDPSGLFIGVSDDPSAEHHRKTAVANLTTLEAEYAKSSIDYDALTKLMFENERTLGHIKKLEPNANSSKYYDRYNPIKARAEKENGLYAEATKIEKLFEQEFRAPVEYKSPNVMTFRTDTYAAHQQCYCRNYKSEVKTYDEYTAKKAEYEKLTSQLVGYSNADTKTLFSNMDACIANGNKYAVWASKENVQKEVVDFSTTNKVAKPKMVIEQCKDYLEALDRIEADNSLKLTDATKTAIAEGKATVNKVKTENETYISSGEYQKYLDKFHAAEIAKVFLPKAVASNPTMEEAAKKYIKGAEYAAYLKERSDPAVASTVKAVTLTKQPWVKKNEYDLPVYQYHEFWVSYKGADGKCYMAAVYASYTYKGGGTYDALPNWGADAPEEMACENVAK